MHWTVVCSDAQREARTQIEIVMKLLESTSLSIERIAAEVTLMEEVWNDFEQIHCSYRAIQSGCMQSGMDQQYQIVASDYFKAEEAAAKIMAELEATARLKIEQQAATMAVKPEAVERDAAEYQPEKEAPIVVSKMKVDEGVTIAAIKPKTVATPELETPENLILAPVKPKDKPAASIATAKPKAEQEAAEVKIEQEADNGKIDPEANIENATEVNEIALAMSTIEVEFEAEQEALLKLKAKQEAEKEILRLTATKYSEQEASIGIAGTNFEKIYVSTTSKLKEKREVPPEVKSDDMIMLEEDHEVALGIQKSVPGCMGLRNDWSRLENSSGDVAKPVWSQHFSHGTHRSGLSANQKTEALVSRVDANEEKVLPACTEFKRSNWHQSSRNQRVGDTRVHRKFYVRSITLFGARVKIRHKSKSGRESQITRCVFNTSQGEHCTVNKRNTMATFQTGYTEEGLILKESHIIGERHKNFFTETTGYLDWSYDSQWIGSDEEKEDRSLGSHEVHTPVGIDCDIANRDEIRREDEVSAKNAGEVLDIDIDYGAELKLKPLSALVTTEPTEAPEGGKAFERSAKDEKVPDDASKTKMKRGSDERDEGRATDILPGLPSNSAVNLPANFGLSKVNVGAKKASKPAKEVSASAFASKGSAYAQGMKKKKPHKRSRGVQEKMHKRMLSFQMKLEKELWLPRSNLLKEMDRKGEHFPLGESLLLMEAKGEGHTAPVEGSGAAGAIEASEMTGEEAGRGGEVSRVSDIQPDPPSYPTPKPAANQNSSGAREPVEETVPTERARLVKYRMKGTDGNEILVLRPKLVKSRQEED